MSDNEKPSDEIPFPATEGRDEAPVNAHPWWTVPLGTMIRDWLRGVKNA